MAKPATFKNKLLPTVASLKSADRRRRSGSAARAVWPLQYGGLQSDNSVFRADCGLILVSAGPRALKHAANARRRLRDRPRTRGHRRPVCAIDTRPSARQGRISQTYIRLASRASDPSLVRACAAGPARPGGPLAGGAWRTPRGGRRRQGWRGMNRGGRATTRLMPPTAPPGRRKIRRRLLLNPLAREGRGRPGQWSARAGGARTPQAVVGKRAYFPIRLA